METELIIYVAASEVCNHWRKTRSIERIFYARGQTTSRVNLRRDAAVVHLLWYPGWECWGRGSSHTPSPGPTEGSARVKAMRFWLYIGSLTSAEVHLDGCDRSSKDVRYRCCWQSGDRRLTSLRNETRVEVLRNEKLVKGEKAIRKSLQIYLM